MIGIKNYCKDKNTNMAMMRQFLNNLMAFRQFFFFFILHFCEVLLQYLSRLKLPLPKGKK